MNLLSLGGSAQKRRHFSAQTFPNAILKFQKTILPLTRKKN